MRVAKVIEYRVWVHEQTGRKASIYGALPYVGMNDGWNVESRGYTWMLSDGTVGMGRVPAKTYDEAVAVMERVNAKFDADKREYDRIFGRK